MMTKKLLIIALLTSILTPFFAQKPIVQTLHFSSAIVDLLRENTSKMVKNRAKVAQNTFYTEGSSERKVQLFLDKKSPFDTDIFPLSLVISSNKKATIDGHFNVVRYMSLFSHFDSDRGAGGGLTITY